MNEGLMIILCFIFSALFSGLETGCYSLNRIRLKRRVLERDKNAIRVQRFIARPYRFMFTVLIGNNIAIYLLSSQTTNIFLRKGFNTNELLFGIIPWNAEILATLILVFPVFIFCEILPKNYFRFHRTGKGGDRRVEDIGQFRGIIPSDSICGCCVMFKTSIVKKAIKDYPKRKTVLDEDFFFGPEDMELSHRIKRYGKILVNLDYYAYHKVSQSIHVSGVKSNIYFATIGWLLITKKICNNKDQIITRTFFLLRAILHIIKLFYKKDKEMHIGFLLGLKDYFLKY